MTRPTTISYLPPSSLVEHTESHRIPEMSAEEWADFIESVRARGVITDPIFALPDGRVFDGRHRLRAATELSLRIVPAIIWDISEGEALRRMSESAVLRRSLLPGQRAAIVLEFTELVEELREKARISKLSGLMRGGEAPVFPDLETRSPQHTHVELAEKAGIGKSSMAMLQAVQREDTDLFSRVKAGDITINKAYTEIKKRKEPVVEPPPQRTTSPKRDKLDELRRKTEASPPTPVIAEEPALSEGNTLRYRINNDFNECIVRFVADYDALKYADAESVRLYCAKLTRLVEGGLLLLAEFEKEEPVRLLFEQMGLLIGGARTEAGKQTIIQTIMKGEEPNV